MSVLTGRNGARCGFMVSLPCGFRVVGSATMALISAMRLATSSPAPFPASVTVGGWPFRNISR